MKSDSSETEFEDAIDTVAPLPPPIRSTPIHSRPSDLSSSSNSAMSSFSAQSTRRNRLATLRTRMQTEFGASGSLGGIDDPGCQSETTSIASWGRNLLMERRSGSAVIAVCPADTLSTKAADVLPYSSPFAPIASPSSTCNTIMETPFKAKDMSMCYSDTSFNRTTIVEEKTMIAPMTPTSPPPSQPPPPLPERVSGTVSANTTPPAPPPLPPRKTPARATSIDTSTTTTLDATPNASSVFSTPSSGHNSSTNTVLKSINVSVNSISTDDAPKSSGGSTPSVTDSYGKKRGHAKTNSLDRGLTLAKSLKSGPFPPPSSAAKSSSLNRGCSPSEMMVVGAICEEDQAAHNVIEQIADSILSSHDSDDERTAGETVSPRDVLKKLQTKCSPPALGAVGEESSTTSTPTRTNDSVPSLPQASVAPRYENLYPQKLDFMPASDEMPTSEEPSSSMLDTSGRSEDAYGKTNYFSESIDPITRDVQRRMSMKDQSATDLHNYQEVSENGNASVQSGLEHAKNLVRSYGSIASGFFRGAFTKAKKTITNPTNPPQALSSKDEEEDAGSESDEGTASVSENVPPSQTSTPATKPLSAEPEIICRPKNHKRGPYDFDQLRVVQELSKEHTGAVWCLKFSVCGRLLASAGQDNIVRVWVLKNHLSHFNKVRERLNQQTGRNNASASGSGIGDQLQHAMQDIENVVRNAEDKKSIADDSGSSSRRTPDEETSSPGGASSSNAVYAPKPFCVFRGHTADVLDISWSRNYFILTCGMDRTVKLWHLARSECLCCFQHMDFVTCISFMPKDDRYFISGSMDGKIRLWHIPEKKVALWNEVEQVKFITAITFVRNGKFVVVGTYNGRCFFYTTDQLKYHTVIDVRSTRGKNARGHKITSLAVHGDKLLVTSNDSRIRMYDLRDMDLTCKFRGAQIEQSQIRASFSPDGKHILCGSEDNYIYIWRASDFSPSLSVRKDRNNMWERVKAHNSVVTAAVFAPKPQFFFSLLEDLQRSHSVSISSSVMDTSQQSKRSINRMDSESSTNVVSTHGALSTVTIPSSVDVGLSSSGISSASGASASVKDRQMQGDVIVSADLTGCIKVIVNPSRLKTGSSHFFATEYN